MSKRVAFYLRVSTDGQTTDNQRLELEKVAKQRDWEIVTVFDDNGVSGSKGREHRKQFDEMIKDATRGKFDLVAAWSVDRLGRSLQDLVNFMSELHAVGCDLYLHQQGVDSTTPAGKAMFGMCGVFAEFERTMIQERVKAGLERARAMGKRIGRPKISDRKRERIIEAHGNGLSRRKISKEVGVSYGTVHNVVQGLTQ
jgi:DNA invertase Pin-like site-specific DNA recombinase